ncbi:MAG: GNAT family N-acetyltransferase [Rhodobacteraceae bacterium]|nr:GNAT family N-acetyltransferase [Paracoccaceae bacterium]
MTRRQGVMIGGLQVRFALTVDDLLQVQSLRGTRFLTNTTPQPDRDGFDSVSAHLMVCHPQGQELLATARLRILCGKADFAATYTAQFYDVTALSARYQRALELGRLCQLDTPTPALDALRVLFATISKLVQQSRAALLFGCTSFPGADPARHHAALASLRANHLGPEGLRPAPRAPDAVPLPPGSFDARDGKQGIPALLRMYLGMGGWVSDHAVRDHKLNTLHVFTALPTDAVPPTRRRALDAVYTN